MRNILTLSISFVCLFSAYNAFQNMATSLLPGNLGNVSLAVLYATVSVSVFTGPIILHTIGDRATLVAGAAMYVIYMASLIKIVEGVVIAFSVVIGFGAAILWIAVGVYITRNSTADTYGRNTGIFWSIFQLSQVFGNLCTYLVMPLLSSTQALFIGFTAMGAVGTSGLLLLRPPPAALQGGADTADATTVKHVSMAEFCHGVLQSARLLFTPTMALHIPLMFFSGMELSFWTGEFPQLLSTNKIGLVLTFVGIGEVIGGLTFGRLGDAIGRRWSFLVGVVCYSGALVISACIKLRSAHIDPIVGGEPLVAFLAAILFGLGDSSFNTNIYASVSHFYGSPEGAPPPEHLQLSSETTKLLADDSINNGSPRVTTVSTAPAYDHALAVRAFAAFQLVQNLGAAFGFFYALPCPLHGADGTYTQVYVQASILVVATVGFFIVSRKGRPQEVTAVDYNMISAQ